MMNSGKIRIFVLSRILQSVAILAVVFVVVGCEIARSETSWEVAGRSTSIGRSLGLRLEPVNTEPDGSIFAMDEESTLIATFKVSLVERIEETILYRCTNRSVTVAGLPQVDTYLISDPPLQAIPGVTGRAVIDDVPLSIRETPRVITQNLSFSSFPATGEYALVAGACAAWPETDDSRLVYRGAIGADFGVSEALEIELSWEDCERLLSYPVVAFDLWVRMELVETQADIGEVEVEERFASALKRRRIGDLVTDP